MRHTGGQMSGSVVGVGERKSRDDGWRGKRRKWRGGGTNGGDGSGCGTGEQQAQAYQTKKRGNCFHYSSFLFFTIFG